MIDDQIDTPYADMGFSATMISHSVLKSCLRIAAGG